MQTLNEGNLGRKSKFGKNKYFMLGWFHKMTVAIHFLLWLTDHVYIYDIFINTFMLG